MVVRGCVWLTVVCVPLFSLPLFFLPVDYIHRITLTSTCCDYLTSRRLASFPVLLRHVHTTTGGMEGLGAGLANITFPDLLHHVHTTTGGIEGLGAGLANVNVHGLNIKRGYVAWACMLSLVSTGFFPG